MNSECDKKDKAVALPAAIRFTQSIFNGKSPTKQQTRYKHLHVQTSTLINKQGTARNLPNTIELQVLELYCNYV